MKKMKHKTNANNIRKATQNIIIFVVSNHML